MPIVIVPKKKKKMEVKKEAFKGGGGMTAQLTRVRKGRKEFQRKFCKLVAEIKGEEYEETKYFRPNINVTASDVRLVEKELKKINLNVFINKKK